MIGGPADIAYANAQKDYERIADNIPVVMLNSKDGHSGTYYEKYGGNYAKAVIKWLDWQLKGCVGQSALFLDDEYLKMKFPEWQGVRKNFWKWKIPRSFEAGDYFYEEIFRSDPVGTRTQDLLLRRQFPYAL